MRSILVAKFSYYLSPDGQKVYKRGDKDMPPGSRLLVREGSPVDPAVAEQYGLETEGAQDVARVPTAVTTPPADRSLGVSKQAEAGYRRIETTAEVHRETETIRDNARRSGAGSSAQIGLMAAGEINRRLIEQTPEGEERVLDTLTNQQIGVAASGGDPDITKRLEQGEREALARHKAGVAAAEADVKQDIKREEAQGKETVEAAAAGDASGDAATTDAARTDAPGATAASAAPPSRTKEIAPATGSSKGSRKSAAKGGAARGGKKSTGE
jgi:hypothetical protein